MKVTKNLTPAEELNKLLGLIPVNHPAKTEVSSYLTQIGNITSGLKPDGSEYLPGETRKSNDELVSQLTMSTLIEKGFEVIIKNPSDKDKALKNFLISAVKNGENVDVGSLVAAFLPAEAMSLMSKVFQTDITGKNIFQLKDIALNRLKDLQSQVEGIQKQAKAFMDSLTKIAETYGELPTVANALLEMTVVAEGIENVANTVEAEIKKVEETLEEIQAELLNPEPTTTTAPEETPPNTLPEIPPAVKENTVPTPEFEPEDVELSGDEEETPVIFE